jgi:hypothetical protein
MESSLTRKGPKHTWKFFRAGGFDQVRLETGADLAALDQLDQKLWVALACPIVGLEFDARTLALLDTNQDGRIRASEILAAVKWMVACLKNPDDLLAGASTLPLAAIREDTPEGKKVLSTVKEVLKGLGKAQAQSIGPEDTESTSKILEKTSFNGDGVVPAEAAAHPTVEAAIKDIMGCVGSKVDRSGKPGVTRELIDQFFKEAQAFVDWQHNAEKDPAILPLGPLSTAAAGALEPMRAKIEDFFVRCRLAAFDPRAASAMNRDEKDLAAVGATDLSVTSTALAGLPLARVEAGRALPLREGLNPAWAGRVAKLREDLVKPLLGDRDTLSEADWAKILAAFAAHDTWRAAKPATTVEKLGLARLQELLSGGTLGAIIALIDQDLAREPEFNSLSEVDRLVHYHRDLYRLLCNFVSFHDFYSRKRKAIFQVGTLYLDQRSCEMTIRIEDLAKHAGMAHLSYTQLAYCECVRRNSGEKMTIAAAFTAGDSDNLTVGRNGIFYDRSGRDWDATVVKLIENPISIRQAFWSPYKRVLRWAEEQVAKRAAAADAASTDKLTGAVAAGAAGAEPAKPAAPPPKSKIDIGVVAALGVAVGGITAALGALMQSLFGLGIWMPLGFIGLVLMISGPSMIIAWLKLRRRNLGPLLDASGWAVNARALVNLPFGRSLTGQAKLPSGSKRDRHDPYAVKHGKRNVILVLLIILALGATWFFGWLDPLLPKPIKSSSVLGAGSSAATAEQPAPPPSAAQGAAPAPSATPAPPAP